MKIVLNDPQDIQDFIALCAPALLLKWNPGLALTGAVAREVGVEDPCGAARQQMDQRLLQQVAPDGLPTDIAQPERVEYADVAPPTSDEPENDGLPGVDADGAPYNTDWHSDPAKLNADGRWRARRKRDEDAYKAWLQELAVTASEPPVAADAEPVATETHALPQNEQEDGVAPVVSQQEVLDAQDAPEQSEARTVDLQALVAASFDQAASQSTDVRELLNAAQAFTTTHGHAKFNELKSAVAPIDGNSFGKALQLFSPEERQLMMACLVNYPTHKEA